jgi:hypothetical protein
MIVDRYLVNNAVAIHNLEKVVALLPERVRRGRPDHDRLRRFCVRFHGRLRERRIAPAYFPSSSGGRGIRTHEDVTALMVFKTIAIGH